MRCAVCLHINFHSINLECTRYIPWSPLWCPHPHCQAHVCKDHQIEVHDYYKDGVILKEYHNKKRVQHTSEHSGRKEKKEKQKNDVKPVLNCSKKKVTKMHFQSKVFTFSFRNTHK